MYELNVIVSHVSCIFRLSVDCTRTPRDYLTEKQFAGKHDRSASAVMLADVRYSVMRCALCYLKLLRKT